MYNHFHAAGQIQTALIVGDLEGVREPATWLANSDQFDDLDGSEDGVQGVRAAARRIEHATTIRQAAQAAGQLAGACAECHEAANDGPRFHQEDMLREGSTAIDHMMRHLWAMDRMWEGLISGSTENWVAGASAIADEHPEGALTNPAAIGELGDRLHRQASDARMAPVSRRPALYGDLIETCAACHERTGVGPD
jgi:cytochrome c553